MTMRCLVGLVALVAASAVAADTITVCLDGACDHVSVQAAIDAVQDGDVVEVGPGVYAERDPINPGGRSILIIGTVIDGVPETILDGSHSHRVIICDSGEDGSTEFTGLIVQNGLADGVALGGTIGRGGGMLISGSSPRVTNCIFRNNVALERGGAIANRRGDFAPAEPPSNPTITNCVFHDNQAPNGGAIRNDDGSSPIITDCVFRKNSAMHPMGGSGGAIDNWFLCDPVLIGCAFIENETNGRGGAVANWNRGEVTIIDCLMQENLSGEGGGGAIFESGFAGSVTSLGGTTLCTNMEPQIVGPWQDLGGNTIGDDCLITVCHDGSCDFNDIQEAIDSSADGGTVAIQSGTYPVTTALQTLGKSIRLLGSTDETGRPDTIIERSTKVTDSRMVNCIGEKETVVTLENLIIRNGRVTTTSATGAGLRLVGMSGLIRNCFFVDNVCNDDGGAIYAESANLIFEGCRFESNQSLDDDGGAVAFNGSLVECSDCEFTGNFSQDDGGALYATGESEIRLMRCSLGSNQSAEDGGALDASNSSIVWIEDCSIRGNDAVEEGGALDIDWTSSCSIMDTEICANSLPQIDGAWTDQGGNFIQIGCCLGDIDGSGMVDGSDLNTLLSRWDFAGKTSSDLNGDLVVDGADLNVLLGAWGVCP